MQRCLKSYIPNAKYCHGCRKSVKLANSDTIRFSEQGASTGRLRSRFVLDYFNKYTTSHLLKVLIVLARKANEANIDLNRKKDGKRMKLHDKSGKSTEIKINDIGIMTKRENALACCLTRCTLMTN